MNSNHAWLFGAVALPWLIACGDSDPEPANDSSSGTSSADDETGDDGPQSFELSDPACMPACVGDIDAVTPDVLDVNCNVIQTVPISEGINESGISECPSDAMVPDGAEVCWIGVFGAELDAACADAGWNFEFRFVRRDGAPAPAGASIEATCQLSQNVEVDCPNL